MQSGRFVARCLGLGTAICLSVAISAQPTLAQSAAALRGASQFGDGHVVTRTLLRFEELVRQYYGKPVEFALYQDSSRGLERQYFDFMSQGATVDYAIVSPVHMAGVSKTARLIEAPFLFRDADHWKAALEAGALKHFADEIAEKAEVMIIGLAGGSVRNIYTSKPVESAADLKGLKIRVPGAPLWSEAFEAGGMTPSVVASSEVFGAIQKGAIAAAEGDAASIEATRLYEVAPTLAMTAHAIAIRLICFSAKTFRLLPADLQEAIRKAGAEAAAYGREIEIAEDAARLDALVKAEKLRRVELKDRAAMKTAADPAIVAYAKESGAEALLTTINAVK